MARSGSTDFNVNQSGIVRGAIRVVEGMGGKLPGGRKDGTSELKDASEALNMMLKQWQSDGVGLWLNKEINLFLAYRDGSYSLGSDHASATIVETEISSAASSGASSIEVDSTTGMTAVDAIGIELDDGTLQWTTISSVTDSDTLALSASLTGGAAVDNNVYTYTTKSTRPLDITEARLHRDDATDTPLNILTRQKWMDISTKDNNGTPTCIYYDPQLDSGILHVWSRPDEVSNYIKLTARMPVQDFDAAENDPDFPAECFRAVQFNLAIDLSYEYTDIDPKRFAAVERKAAYLYNALVAYDAEYGSVTFEPNWYE